MVSCGEKLGFFGGNDLKLNPIKHLSPFVISWMLLLGVWGNKSNVPLLASPPIDPLLNVTPEETMTVAQQPNLSMDLVEAQTEFGFNLFSAILSEEGGQNILISPASVAIALSMVYNGADGETQQAMAEPLALQGMSLEALNTASASLIDALANPDPMVQVDIANSLWAHQDFPLYPTFVEQVTEFYNAEAANLDFDNPSTPDIINAWVAEKTQGKISRMVDQTSSEEEVLFLLNAIYFNGTWTTTFDPEQTTEQPFYLPNGATKPHLQMVQSDDYHYYETAQFQAVSLPYGDNRLSLYVFLPKQNASLADFQASLSAETWSDWIPQFGRRAGLIKLPKFQLEYKTELIPMLTTLGMGIAFDRGRADFAELSPIPTYISEALHKTFIDVNEEGTEAAAVTSIALTPSSAPMEPPFRMVVDRPFFMAIRDNATGAILFMGSIVEP